VRDIAWQRVSERRLHISIDETMSVAFTNSASVLAYNTFDI